MEGILLKVVLVVEILALVYVILYLGGAIMAWNKTTSIFTCKKCNKFNDLLRKKCEYCDAEMKQWVARYKNCLYKRINCKNDDGIPSWKIAQNAMIFDFVMLTVWLCLVIIAMVFTIRAM